jgi:peptidoglycan hydrolase-like protein with peptidoglycan-binding domain
MKRSSLLMIASAVAAALAAPDTFGQTSGIGGATPRGGNVATPTDLPRASGSAARTDRQMGRSVTGGSMQGYDASVVRNVQQALQDKGFDVGSIDGVMGPRTEAALREFQQRQGLKGSGQLDQETLAALNVDKRGTVGPRASDPGPTGSRGGPEARGSDPGSTGSSQSGTPSERRPGG